MATTAKKERRLKAEALIDDTLDEVVEQINEALEKVEAAMRPYEKLQEKRNRLLRMRDAAAGGNLTTGGGGTQLRFERVVEAVRVQPGIGAQEIANQVGASRDAVQAHLRRGRGDRLMTDDAGHWYVRDPKNGKNSIEDYEEE